MTILPAAILFDMDGTLTCPMLDFPRIKRDMGIGAQPILEALAKMAPDQRAAAERILHRHEEDAAAQSTLNPGCLQMLDFLTTSRIPAAVITRNSLKSAQTVLDRHALCFDILITRDDGLFKPDPAPLLLACRRLNVDPARALMVGDGQYDIEAGRAAAIPTAWLSHNRPRPFAALPTHVIPDLFALLDLLRAALPPAPDA